MVRGSGHFMDDPRLPNQAYAAFVRSPHAHARVLSVKTEEASKSKGVLAVLTAEDMKAAGVGSVSRHPPVQGRVGKAMIVTYRPALAGEKVMHVGDPVAMVVAETAVAAQDAADLVTVDYEELPPVVALDDAMKGATQLYPEAPGNLIVDWPGPVPSEDNEREVEKIIKEAPHVARVRVANQRMVVASMETRGATGEYDAAKDSYTLHACSQSASNLRMLVAPVMGVPNEKLRVITEDVGGAFGMKTPPYPEYAALLVAARKLGRPVHWQSTRSEAFVTDTQARDTVTEAELALDDKGKFLALRVRHMCNQGAYVSTAGVGINTNNFARCLPGMYRIPKVDVGIACYFSNTLPIGPYRGAGRPEANYALERVVEEAARVVGMDPVRLRKKNLIPPSAMPYKTAIGNTYDSGDFPGIVDAALKLADYANFNKRRREVGAAQEIPRHRHLLHAGARRRAAAGRGFGQLSGRRQDDPRLQRAIDRPGPRHRVPPPARGQARHRRRQDRAPPRRHRTRPDRLRLGRLALGHVRRQRHRAYRRRDAGQGQEDRRRAAGSVRRRHPVPRRANSRWSAPTARFRCSRCARRAKELGENLDTKDKAETPLTFPNGCHIAEVEIDPDTGLVDLVTYTAVDDCGNPLDTMIVEGQVHGSIAQGLGQALVENAVYDPASGQLVTGSFMDYGMPHAEIMPVELREALRPDAGQEQSARRQGHRRGRHHGGDRGGDERHLARHPQRRRRPHGHAGDAGEGVGGVPEGGGSLATKSSNSELRVKIRSSLRRQKSFSISLKAFGMKLTAMLINSIFD